MTMRHYLDLLLERSLAQRLLFLLGAVLLLAALDYALLHRPRARSIARAAARLDLARLDEARLRRELGRLPGLREELAGLRRELRSRLPPAAEPSSVLESVTVRAAAAGLEVVRLHPGAAVEGEHFTERPVKVDLQGGFHGLLKFLERAPAPRRSTSPGNLAVEAAGVEDGRTVLRITLDMATLRMRAVEEAGAPAPPAAEGRAGGVADAGPSVPEPAGAAVAEAAYPAEPLPAATLPPPRRDPFQPYAVPAQPHPGGPPEPDAAPVLPPEPDPGPRYRAAGIVWQRHAAVALVRDAEGRGHVVQPGSRLDGPRTRVKAVTPCEVILETARAGAEPGETRLAVPRCRLPRATGPPPGG